MTDNQDQQSQSVDGLTYTDMKNAGWTDRQIYKSQQYRKLLPSVFGHTYFDMKKADWLTTFIL